MALPTGPIPRVAFEEYIEESWGDSVAQSLNNMTEMFDFVFWTPTAGEEYLAPTTYTSTGDHDLWFTFGGPDVPHLITVPDWANHVLVFVHLNGIYLDGEGDATYQCQVKVGPNAGRRGIRKTATQLGSISSDPDQRDWFDISWIDRIPCSSIEGDRKVQILAGRYASTQRWAIDTSSDVAAFLIFQDTPIRFYPDL